MRINVFDNKIDKRIFGKIIKSVIFIKIDADVFDDEINEYLYILSIMRNDIVRKNNKY